MKFNTIDFNNIIYPYIQNNELNKIILIKYFNNQNKIKTNNFHFQTPKLELYYNDDEFNIKFVGPNMNKINDFIIFLNNLEKNIINDIHENASRWFNLDKNNKIINFKKIIKNGILSIKLYNDFETLLQINNKKINKNKIPKFSLCKLMLECYGLCIDNNDITLIFKPVIMSFILKENIAESSAILQENIID